MVYWYMYELWRYFKSVFLFKIMFSSNNFLTFIDPNIFSLPSGLTAFFDQNPKALGFRDPVSSLETLPL